MIIKNMRVPYQVILLATILTVLSHPALADDGSLLRSNRSLSVGLPCTQLHSISQSSFSSQKRVFGYKISICIESNEGREYRTEQVGVFTYAWRLVFHASTTRTGACGDCSDLCDHRPCFLDFLQVDDDRCECERNEPVFLCGTGATCDEIYDECECPDGLVGDPLVECSSDIAPIAGFVANTTIEGNLNQFTDAPVLIELEDTGDFVEVSGNVTTRAAGLVSLAGAASSINLVRCEETETSSSITIVFEPGWLATDEDLLVMFPMNSILVVNEDVFGSCSNRTTFSDEDEIPFGTEAFASATDSGDGFVIIESVVRVDGTTVVVSGQPTFAFSMFEDASLTVTTARNATSRARNLQGLTLEFGIDDFAPIPFLVAKAVGKLIDDSRIESIQADFGFWGFEFTVRISQEFRVEADIDVSLDVGVPAPINIPLPSLLSEQLAPPPFKLINLMNKVGILDSITDALPDIKIGLYFEVALVLQLTRAALTTKFGPFADYDFTSGRKVVDITVWFRPESFDLGISQTVIEDLSPASSFTSGIRDIEDERGVVEVDIFAGVRPQVYLYLTKYMGAGIGIDGGVDVKTKSLQDDQFFPRSMLAGVPQAGPCEICHQFEADASGVLRSPAFRGAIKFPFEILGWNPPIYRINIPLIPGGPELRNQFLQVCAWPDENDVTCGNNCCDREREGVCLADEQTCCYPEAECCIDADCGDGRMCESGECTGCEDGQKECNDICIPSEAMCCPGDTCCPEDLCCNDPCCDNPDNCGNGGANGDPHMTTFDGLRYSCQAEGDFVLLQSTEGLLIQAHFKKIRTLVSLATGVAVVSGPGQTLVEVIIPAGLNVPILLVDGATISSFYEDDFVRVVESGSSIKIFVKQAGVAVYADLRLPSSSPHLNVRVTVPPAYGDRSAIVGLLGSPDNDPSNDWMDKDGNTVVLPMSASDRAGEGGYNYCTSQWCISNPSDSLFTNSTTFPFDGTGCTDSYPGGIDTSSSSPELVQFCGLDIQCLTDGWFLGLEGAQSLLSSEALTLSSSAFQVQPQTIIVGQSVNAVFTVNLAGIAADLPADLESFRLYRVDANTLEASTTFVATLFDNGLGVGDDQVAGDFVFSNVLATLSLTAGESFGFRIVPVINGVADPSSPLTSTNLNAIRSYSVESGIGIPNNSSSTFDLELNSIDDVVLVVEYSWPNDQPDLDTGTSFLGSQAGFSCGQGTEYLAFSGDDISRGGLERVRVLLGSSSTDGQWLDSVSIELRAGWYSCGGSGPISVTIYTENESGIPDANAVSYVATPGCQSGCAVQEVGRIIVTLTENVLIRVVPPDN